MINLNLQEESHPTELSMDDIINLHDEELGILNNFEECKQLLSSTLNLISLEKSLKNYGGYQGFESLIADYQDLNKLIGADICTISAEQFEECYSNEIFRDTFNKFMTKFNALFGRLGDRIRNFFKTLLPFKEKYYGEMKALKAELAGKKINEEQFKQCKVASALSKARFEEYIKKQNDVCVGLTKVCETCTGPELDKFLDAADKAPDSIRTTFGLFVNAVALSFAPTSLLGAIFIRGGTFIKPPVLSWFETSTVADLGWTGADVIKIIDTSIKEIESTITTHSLIGKMVVQMQAVDKKIELLRAENKVLEAIDMREQIARLQEFFFQIMEACNVYETMIRRTMYFATYIGRAARKCAM